MRGRRRKRLLSVHFDNRVHLIFKILKLKNDILIFLPRGRAVRLAEMDSRFHVPLFWKGKGKITSTKLPFYKKYRLFNEDKMTKI